MECAHTFIYYLLLLSREWRWPVLISKLQLVFFSTSRYSLTVCSVRGYKLHLHSLANRIIIILHNLNYSDDLAVFTLYVYAFTKALSSSILFHYYHNQSTLKSKTRLIKPPTGQETNIVVTLTGSIHVISNYHLILNLF